jgi:hypothetical protein
MMNSLSIMLYLADVSASLSIILAICGMMLFGIAAARTMAAWVDDTCDGALRHFFGVASKCTLPLLIVAALLPSKTTIYAIAASETSEEILASPTAGKAVKALNVWLDRQIEGQK